MNNQNKSKSLLHHRLTNTEWTNTVRDLTFAQVKVLYHIKTLDPFGDRKLEISISQMARDLGLNKSTVSRALKELDKLELLDVTLLKVKVQVSPKGKDLPLFSKEEESDALRGGNTLRGGNGQFAQETAETSAQQQIPEGNEEEPKCRQHKTSGPSQTSSDSSNIKEIKDQPILKIKDQDQVKYDQWYESAYALGWVAGREGPNVILKRGPFEGCSRHWLDVKNNKEMYFPHEETRQLGFSSSAAKTGLTK